jgi:hypothetical protein
MRAEPIAKVSPVADVAPMRRTPDDRSPAQQPAVVGADLLLRLQRSAGNQAVLRILAASPSVQRDYTDVPTKATWVQDTDLDRVNRSDDLQAIDDALEGWEAVKGGNDTPAKVESLRTIRARIRTWDNAKILKYAKKKGQTSVRKGDVDDLTKIVDLKIKEYSDQHAVELQPIADEYVQAAEAYDFDTAHAKGTVLATAHNEFLIEVAAGALARLKGTDKKAWGTMFFSAPKELMGSKAVNPMALAGLGNYAWITTAFADTIINKFIVPMIDVGQTQPIMSMLQHRPFRKALQAAATPKTWADLSDGMPLLRITAGAEQMADTYNVGDADIDELALAVFYAFLGDLDKSGLIYSTNSGKFKMDEFVLGKADRNIGAPCMMLSSLFNNLFKMVTAQPPPVLQGEDPRPMLTKPLASIGNKGILTREKTFKGNVSKYQKTEGYDNVNRIFFGDGHVWLEINGHEFDPTLGIHGPKGTVANQVELIFTRSGKNFKAGKLKATRNDTVPPGGAKLFFDRTVVIS